MRRKKIIEAAVVCILLLLLGAYMEFSDRSMDDKNRIIRGSPGSGRQEVELTLNAGEKLKNYDYQVSVPAQCIDEKTAQSYFSRAEKEIDETFFPEGEEAAHVTEQVHMKPSYVKGLVKADWTLDQYNAVDVDGTIREDQLDPQGELVQASVALTCEKYREEYTFSLQNNARHQETDKHLKKQNFPYQMLFFFFPLKMKWSSRVRRKGKGI